MSRGKFEQFIFDAMKLAQGGTITDVEQFMKIGEKMLTLQSKRQDQADEILETYSELLDEMSEDQVLDMVEVEEKNILKSCGLTLNDIVEYHNNKNK